VKKAEQNLLVNTLIELAERPKVSNF
jgi:hypothetical protein